MTFTMADSYTASSARPLVAPGLAALLGLTGLSSGIYALAWPLEAVRPFGLHPPLTGVGSNASAFQTSLVRVYGLRNIGTGLATLGLAGLWALQPEGTAREMVKRCLGLCLSTGSLVAFGDGVVVGRYAEEIKTGSGGALARMGEMGRRAAGGHAVAGVIVLGLGLGLLFT